MDQLLNLLATNARLTNAQLAAMLSTTEEAVAAQIAAYEAAGVIRGYKAIIDWDKTSRDLVIARIELKVIPQKGMGFEEIASIISEFEEVETVYLMSGGCDIAVTVAGKTFKDVALFVAHRLAPMESVQSTSTSFVLRKYKERGVMVCLDAVDEREGDIL